MTFYDYRRMLKKAINEVFGQRLREARLRAKIPQDKLGVQIGLDEGTASARVSRYETGVHEPPFDIAVKLAHVLNVPTAFFYCENEDLSNFLLLWKNLSEAEREAVTSIAEKLLSSRSDSNTEKIVAFKSILLSL